MTKVEGALRKEYADAVLGTLRNLANNYETYGKITLEEARRIASKVPYGVAEVLREIRER